MIGTFIAAFSTVVGAVYYTYPDTVSYPREFENGLEKELGGAGAVRVSPIAMSIFTKIPCANKTLNQARMAGDAEP